MRLVRECARLVVLLLVLVVLVAVRLCMFPVQWTTGGVCVGMRLGRRAMRRLRLHETFARSETATASFLAGSVVLLCTRTGTCGTLSGLALVALLASKHDRWLAARRGAAAPDAPDAPDAPNLAWPLRDLQLMRAEPRGGGATMPTAPSRQGGQHVAVTPSGVSVHSTDLERHGGTIVEFAENPAPHAGTQCCHFLMPHANSPTALKNAVDAWSLTRAQARTCGIEGGLAMVLVVRMFPHGRLADLVCELQRTRHIRVATIPSCTLPERTNALKDTRAMFKRLLEMTDPAKRRLEPVGEVALPHSIVAPPESITRLVAAHNEAARAIAEEARVELEVRELEAQLAVAERAEANALAEHLAEQAAREAEAAERRRAEAIARTIQANREAARRREAALKERKRLALEAERRERVANNRRTSVPAPPKPTPPPPPPTPPTPPPMPRSQRPCHFGPLRCRNGAACPFSHDYGPSRRTRERKPAAPPAVPPVEHRNKDDNNNEEDGDDTCVVCLDAPRSHISTACFHLVLCDACAGKCAPTCPLCNAETSFHRVYK